MREREGNSVGSGGDDDTPESSGGDDDTPESSGGDDDTPESSGGDDDTPKGTDKVENEDSDVLAGKDSVVSSDSNAEDLGSTAGKHFLRLCFHSLNQLITYSLINTYSLNRPPTLLAI